MTIRYDYSKWKNRRFEKHTRYYVLALEQDLFGDWIITKINGRINSKLGKTVHQPCQSYEEACELLEELTDYRIDARGYHFAGEDQAL